MTLFGSSGNSSFSFGGSSGKFFVLIYGINIIYDCDIITL